MTEKTTTTHTTDDRLSTPLRALSNRTRGPQWIVEQLIPRDAKILIAAHASHGKSRLVHALATSVATGTPFAERYPVPKAGVVLLIDQDTAQTIFVESLQAYANNYGESTNLFPLSHERIHLDTRAGRERFVQIVTALRPDLIILDTFAALVSAALDENRAQDVKRFLSALDEAQAAHPCAIVVCHHLRKASRATDALEAIRGSGALVAAFDVVYTLAKVNERNVRQLGQVLMRPAKTRFSVASPALLKLSTERESDAPDARMTWAALTWQCDVTSDYDPATAAHSKAVCDIVLSRGKLGITYKELDAQLGGAVPSRQLREVILPRLCEEGRLAFEKERHNTYRYYVPRYAPKKRDVDAAKLRRVEWSRFPVYRLKRTKL